MTGPILVSADKLEALAFDHPGTPIEFSDGYGFLVLGRNVFRTICRVGGAS